MVDRKVVVVVAVAVGVVLVGGVAGAMLLGGGGGGGDDTGADGSDGSGDTDGGGGSAATPTQAPATGTTGTDANGTATPAGTAFPTLTPTSVPTPTGTPTVAPTPTDVPTRTAKLPRRFSEEKIETELRRMLNDWRERKGLQPFTNANGSLVTQIDRMATNHSVAMSEKDELVHESHGLTVGQRYEAFDLAERCKFKKQDAQYIVHPKNDAYQFEVLHRTYAGRNYQDGGETVYHENETAVARDIFEEWTSNYVHKEVLNYPEINRIGIGIELTEDNEVWVTGNICESGKTNE
ncbi:hypothetical protein [Halosimplex sp. TS25]|uniref:CAP domain-containing protein n=1 Tax=Halosimplex rarum TaxID=3396619 RepID=UPI0039EB9896